MDDEEVCPAPAAHAAVRRIAADDRQDFRGGRRSAEQFAVQAGARGDGDYTATITNPNNALTTVNGVTFTDAIPANTVLSVADLGLLPGSGPVVFADGVLPPSLLSYSNTSLGSTTDRLDFSRDNGATWTYTPVADANGYDSQVTNIRVRLGGNQVASSSFSIRFRVKVR